MFGNHGLGGLLEEGAHEKSPKCLGGNLGDFVGDFAKVSKRHLRKFNGIPKEHFELYLKECEWRFNNSEIKVQISILKQLVKHDLS